MLETCILSLCYRQYRRAVLQSNDPRQSRQQSMPLKSLLIYILFVINLASFYKGAACEVPMSHSDYDFGASGFTPMSQAKL